MKFKDIVVGHTYGREVFDAERVDRGEPMDAVFRRVERINDHGDVVFSEPGKPNGVLSLRSFASWAQFDQTEVDHAARSTPALDEEDPFFDSLEEQQRIEEAAAKFFEPYAAPETVDEVVAKYPPPPLPADVKPTPQVPVRKAPSPLIEVVAKYPPPPLPADVKPTPQVPVRKAPSPLKTKVVPKTPPRKKPLKTSTAAQEALAATKKRR